MKAAGFKNHFDCPMVQRPRPATIAAVLRPPRGLRGVGAAPAFWGALGELYAKAFAQERDERRLFLWLPVAAGAGVLLYFSADIEPSLIMSAGLCLGFSTLAVVGRGQRMVCGFLIALAALFAGLTSAGLRTMRVAAPVLDRVRIVELTGYVEAVDHRREGARFLLRVASAGDIDAAHTPLRVRLTDRRAPPMEAGAFIKLKARLTPPAHAVIPGGYDFARDAYFSRIGAVGNALGRIDIIAAPAPPGLMQSAMMAVDRARNVLAAKVDAAIGGPAGAVGAAMVTGKRDLLDDRTKELIREAGIFHIITISGIQMTLVAGILFWSIRRLLALNPTLALHYPIKKWAAGAAMIGAVGYDIMTGSRVGTERALFMTLIMMSAILFDRRALTMRNLAFAALAVIIFEPEAILGASFQLSFAAVAALVAVYEGRMSQFNAAWKEDPHGLNRSAPPPQGLFNRVTERILHEPRQMLFATLCATSATASYMANDFHELSPYVLIGNPLTLIIIEFFAVPGALIGTILYPLGLDGPVWIFVGWGIKLALWAAGLIAAAPGSTIHLKAFAPWAIIFLSLAVLSAVIWRTRLMRLTAVPFLLLGLFGATQGDTFDIIVAPGGEAAAVRGQDGMFSVVGSRPNAFATEQWLRADGDGRVAKMVARAPPGEGGAASCDKMGCTTLLTGGGALAIVADKRAFHEDCARAEIIVSRLYAPDYCKAALILDRPKLEAGGAIALKFRDGAYEIVPTRAAMEDRPWAVKARRAFVAPQVVVEEE